MILTSDDLTKTYKYPKFRNMNKNLSVFTINSILHDNYEIDFNVYLPTVDKLLQRDFVWSNEQKSEYIMSILLKRPILPLSIVHVKDKSNIDKFKIIDGKQRLSSKLDYCQNKYPLLYNGNEYYFNDLDKQLQIRLLKEYIVADVVYDYPDEPISDNDLINWFLMINFSGTPQDNNHRNYLLDINR